MLTVTDAEVDNADDIILTDDIELEWIPGVSTIRCAERRVTARADDFILDSDIAAGIEQHLFQKDLQSTKNDIESAIRACLSTNYLLVSSDFSLYILDVTAHRKLPIMIAFNVPNASSDQLDAMTFKVLVNIENQRSYK